MFLLFFSLYMALFNGYWNLYTYDTMASVTKQQLNYVGLLATSIFGDGTYETLGDLMHPAGIQYSFISLISLILATITSIGIVVMAVKGVKKAFGIFFMGIRR